MAVHGNLTAFINSDGKPEDQKGVDGAALVSDQSTLLTLGLVDSTGAPKTTRTTELPYYLNDVLTPTDPAAVATSDLTKISISGSDVDGVIVQACYGGTDFKGYWFTVSTADLSDAEAATRLSHPASGANSQRYFCPVGEVVFVPLPGLSYVWLVSVDNATEDNFGMVYPV